MKRRSRIRQRDSGDCGPACLASVAAHYGLYIPLTRIRRIAGTSARGTTVSGMLQAAEAMGFYAKGVRGEASSISAVPLPAIAHMDLGEGRYHFIVICKAGPRRIQVMDPASGRTEKLRTADLLRSWTGILLLLLPGPGFEKADMTVSVMSRFRRLLRLYSRSMLSVLAVSVIYTLLGLAISLYVRHVFDHVLVYENAGLLHLMGVVMILILTLQLLAGNLKSRILVHTGQHMDWLLIMQYYRHIMRLSRRFFDTMQVGEILSRVTDAVRIRMFLNDTMPGMIVNIFIILFAVLVMFFYYWKLALLMLTLVPLLGVLWYLTNRFNRKWQRLQMERAAVFESGLIEHVGIMPFLGRLKLRRLSEEDTEARLAAVLETYRRGGLHMIYTGGAAAWCTRAYTVLLFWAGAYFVMKGAMSPGTLMSFYALLGYFTGPATELIHLNRSWQDARIAAVRLFEIIDLETEAAGIGEAEIQIPHIRDAGIYLDNIRFAYQPGYDLLKGINLYIAPGSITGLTGESGCGKSTLGGLLLREYEPDSGTVRIGTHPARYFSRDFLRGRIGLVAQNPEFLTGSIYVNIAPGEDMPDMERIVRISEMLGLHAFIESLPEGYHTLLHANARNISGGQRQRIAIAREIYRDPDILIMDEPTAALDVNGRDMVRQLITWCKECGKTLLLITHDRHMLKFCDLVAVLAEGEIAEAGTHEALLLKRGYYFRMHSHF